MNSLIKLFSSKVVLIFIALFFLTAAVAKFRDQESQSESVSVPTVLTKDVITADLQKHPRPASMTQATPGSFNWKQRKGYDVIPLPYGWLLNLRRNGPELLCLVPPVGNRPSEGELPAVTGEWKQSLKAGHNILELTHGWVVVNISEAFFVPKKGQRQLGER